MDNVEKLSRYEMVALLQFFLYTLAPEQRFRLMAEQPLTYAKLAPGAKESVAIEVCTRLGVSFNAAPKE
jgi:hypothetical protein